MDVDSDADTDGDTDSDADMTPDPASNFAAACPPGTTVTELTADQSKEMADCAQANAECQGLL